MVADNIKMIDSAERVTIRGPLSRKQVGALLCISEQRVGQIEREAVAKLLSRLRSIGVDGFDSLFDVADEAIASTAPAPKPVKAPRPRHVKTTELVLQIIERAGHRMTAPQLIGTLHRSSSTTQHAIASLCQQGVINGCSRPKQYGLPAWPALPSEVLP